MNGIRTDLPQIIQRLVINAILFKSDLALFDHLVHDALIYSALWLSEFSFYLSKDTDAVRRVKQEQTDHKLVGHLVVAEVQEQPERQGVKLTANNAASKLY